VINMNENLIFSSPLELGLRSLYILKALSPTTCSIDKLLYLDYLSIYTKDSQVSLDSLHPEYPMRAIELFSRRSALQDGLLLMACKGLIEVEYEEGVFYAANSSTDWFLNGFIGEYTESLLKKTNLIAKAFKELSELEIKNFIDRNIRNWGIEFKDFFPHEEEEVL